MGKIYVVTAGEYSDYHIVAATTSKEHAERIKNKYKSEYDPINCYGLAHIEEFEDSEELQNTMWEVAFDYVGGVAYSIGTYSSEEEHIDIREVREFPGAYYVYVYLYAKDEKTAIKAAAERRAKALAEKEGL